MANEPTGLLPLWPFHWDTSVHRPFTFSPTPIALNHDQTIFSFLRTVTGDLRTQLPTLAWVVGLFLLISPCVAYFLSTQISLGHLLIHLLVNSPFLAGLFYGGYWLEQSSLSSRRLKRISHWFLGGLIGFLLINVGMMTQWGNGFTYNLMWGFFVSSVGGAGGLVIGIFEARTIEQERLAERRRMRQEAARRRSKQFENFARIVSHDLRNPLNVAWGHLELVDDGDQSADLDPVRDALSRMDQIIDDVMTLTWSGQGITAEEMELHRLGEVAETAWSHVDGIHARLLVEENRPVCANSRRLQRLLENLFRNAIEHGRLDVTVRVGALSDGFFVEDDGAGIPDENRETIFEPGFSTGEEGTGLGLNIVRTIAEAHEWNVSATEGRDGGARFEFTGVNKKHKNGHPVPPQRDAESVWSNRPTDRHPDRGRV